MLDALASYSALERIPSAMLSATLLGTAAVVATRRRRVTFDAPFLTISACLAAYVVVPNSAAGGGQISFRLSVFPYLFLLLWLGARPIAAGLRRAAQAVAAAATISLVVMHVATYRALQPYLREFAAVAPQIPVGATLLPVVYSDRGHDVDGRLLSADTKVRPFLHAAGHLAAEGGVIDLTNYEARQGYFPLTYRADVDPSPFIDAETGHLDLEGWEAHAGCPLQYVLVWNVREPRLPGWAPQLQATLDARYDLVSTSPGGFAKLYRRAGPR